MSSMGGVHLLNGIAHYAGLSSFKNCKAMYCITQLGTFLTGREERATCTSNYIMHIDMYNRNNNNYVSNNHVFFDACLIILPSGLLGALYYCTWWLKLVA